MSFLRAQKNPKVPHFKQLLRRLSVHSLPSPGLLHRRSLPGRRLQSTDLPHHASKQAPRQMTLGHHQPVLTGMLHQPPARLHEPLLQAGRGPTADPLRQHRAQRGPPPKVPQVGCHRAQPQPHLVRAESVAGQPRHLHRLLAFFDPLFRCSTLVVEPHHRPSVGLQVRHDETDAPSSNPPPGKENRCARPPAYGPTGRVGNPLMSRSRLSFAGMRMAYFTPRSSIAS